LPDERLPFCLAARSDKENLDGGRRPDNLIQYYYVAGEDNVNVHGAACYGLFTKPGAASLLLSGSEPNPEDLWVAEQICNSR